MELVSAIEAKHYFPQDKSILFIHSFHPKSIFLALLDKARWEGKIIFIKDKPINWAKPKQTIWDRILLRRKLDRIIKMSGEANLLFINYYRAHMRHIINRLRHKNLILIEGGTDALATNALRYIPEQYYYEVDDDRSYWKKLRSWLTNRYIYLDNRALPSVTFFSAYDLEVIYSDHIIKNEYSYIKQWIKEQESLNEVFFLGQPLVEDGYMKSEVYYKYMMKILDYLAGNKIVYLPHPRESETFAEIISKSFGICIRRYTLPIELQIILYGPKPKILTGFWTSAIGNCRHIFGNDFDVKAFYIEPDDLLIKHQYIEDVYQYLKTKQSHKFEVVKFGNVNASE